MVLHPFGRLVLRPIISLMIKEIKNDKNLPPPPYILALNHASFVDDILPYYIAFKYSNKRLRIFVNSRFYKNYFLKKFFNNYDCIPVDIKKDVPNKKQRKKTNDAAFRAARETLRIGDIMAIFPEGSRSKDGKLKKAKPGVARLVNSGVPVVPVGIIGTYEIMPKGAKFPRPRRITLNIGKPIILNKGSGEDFTRKVMKKIAKLIDQEYPY